MNKPRLVIDKVLEITDDAMVERDGETMRRIIFNDDKIMKVKSDGTILPKQIPKIYIDAVLARDAEYQESTKKANAKLVGVRGWLLVYVIYFIICLVRVVQSGQGMTVKMSTGLFETFAIWLIVIRSEAAKSFHVFMLALISIAATINLIILAVNFNYLLSSLPYSQRPSVSDALVTQMVVDMAIVAVNIVWIIYLLNSERVKATFTRPYRSIFRRRRAPR